MMTDLTNSLIPFLLGVQDFGRTALNCAAYGASAFSLIFAFLTVAAAFRFSRPRSDNASEGPFPPVTILKPLKGLDRGLYENLAGFCRLDYPKIQILFTLASPGDPCLGLISRLRQEFPDLDMEVIVSRSRIGFNPKVNNLSNAAPFIKHDLILISDSDVRVRPDFLKKAVKPLADPRVGLVTCFYQSTASRGGLTERLEALSVNAQFLPQAVAAGAWGMRFAMGAVMLVRRKAFEAAGGFHMMANHLADDFILGKSIQWAGYRIEIAQPVVESTPDVGGLLEHLRHQSRWAATIRACQPAGYLGTFLLHGFSLLTLKMLLVGFTAPNLALAVSLWAAKAMATASILHVIDGRRDFKSLWLIPLSEWITFGAWLSGCRVSQVVWRGERYSIRAQGRLVPIGALDVQPAAAEP